MEAKDVRTKLYGSHDPYDNLNILEPDLQGWSTSTAEFERCIEELRPKIIVEAGTWKGWSAFRMVEICQKYYDDFQIICIDTWLGSVEHWILDFQNEEGHIKNVRDSLKNGRCQLYEQFLSNVVHMGMNKHITPFAIDATNGAYTLFNLGIIPDMVYIDAGHEYQSVKMDLMTYAGLLRPGGYLLGDDWHYAPIKQAVKDVFKEKGVTELSDEKYLWIKGVDTQ